MTNQEERAFARRIEQMVLTEARMLARFARVRDEFSLLVRGLDQMIQPGGGSARSRRRRGRTKFKATNVVDFQKRGPT